MKKQIAAAVLAAAAATGVAATTAAPADASVVPNIFWRTCTWSCSPYAQSNGPYNPAYISECNTKNWLGQVTSTTFKWGRC